MAAAAYNLSLWGDSVHVPRSTFEHGGFRRWIQSDGFPERAHATFAEGEVFFDMSPESIEAHNKVKEAFTTTLGRLVREGDLGELYVDGALFTNESAALSTEPDAMFASWATLESGRLTLSSGERGAGIELVGAPDLVLEVVSPSSVRKDMVTLRAAYARAGVEEYWLVDARGDELRFEVLKLEGEAYRPDAAATLPQRSAVLSRTFTLQRERNRVGRWKYQLDC